MPWTWSWILFRHLWIKNCSPDQTKHFETTKRKVHSSLSWFLFRSPKKTFLPLTRTNNQFLNLQYYIYLSRSLYPKTNSESMKRHLSCSPDPTTNFKSKKTFIMATGSNKPFRNCEKTFIMLAHCIHQPIF